MSVQAVKTSENFTFKATSAPQSNLLVLGLFLTYLKFSTLQKLYWFGACRPRVL